MDGKSPSTSLITKMLTTKSNSELISVGEAQSLLMEPLKSPELMICGGLVTGDLELSSDLTTTSPKENTESKSTELKDVVMVK